MDGREERTSMKGQGSSSGPRKTRGSLEMARYCDVSLLAIARKHTSIAWRGQGFFVFFMRFESLFMASQTLEGEVCLAREDWQRRRFP